MVATDDSVFFVVRGPGCDLGCGTLGLESIARYAMSTRSLMFGVTPNAKVKVSP